MASVLPLPPLRSTAPAYTRYRPLRAVIAIWLAAYALLVAVAPIADSVRVHADSVVAHWEDSEQTDCSLQHATSACQFCVVISTTCTDAASLRVHAAVMVAGTEPVIGDVPGVFQEALWESTRPRGPPTV